MRVQQQDKFLRICPDGDFDAALCPRLKKRLNRAIEEQGAAHLCFDLKKTGFIDSSGLGLILGCYKRLAPQGGSVRVICHNETQRRVFTLAGLERILDVTEG